MYGYLTLRSVLSLNNPQNSKMKICETNSSEKMIFTVKWSHSLVESRSENIKLFENFYPAPLVIVQFSQRKFFKKFIFFVPVDAQTHT